MLGSEIVRICLRRLADGAGSSEPTETSAHHRRGVVDSFYLVKTVVRYASVRSADGGSRKDDRENSFSADPFLALSVRSPGGVGARARGERAASSRRAEE